MSQRLSNKDNSSSSESKITFHYIYYLSYNRNYGLCLKKAANVIATMAINRTGIATGQTDLLPGMWRVTHARVIGTVLSINICNA